MKSICKYMAFSKTDYCLLEEKCICESNEKFIADLQIESEEPSQDELWDEIFRWFGKKASISADYALQLMEEMKSKYTISRK